MKRIHLLLPVLLGSCGLMAQQTKVTIDAATMRMTSTAKCLQMDSTTVIEVINYNPAVLSLSITGKNVRIFTEPTGKVGDFIGWPKPSSEEAKKDVTDGQDAAASKDSTEAKRKALEAEKAALNGQVSQLQQQVRATQDAVTALKTARAGKAVDLDRSDPFISAFTWLAPESLNTPDEIAIAQERTDTLFAQLRQEMTDKQAEVALLNTRISELEKKLKELEKDPYPDHLSKLIEAANAVVDQSDSLALMGVQFKEMETIIMDACLSPKEIQELLQKLGEKYGWNNGLHGKEFPLKKELARFDQAYDDFLREPSVTTKLKDDASEKARIDALRSSMNRIAKDFAEADYPTRMSKYLSTYMSMSSPSAYVLRAWPVQAEADMVIFELKAEARAGVQGFCSPQVGTFSFKQYVCGGLKVDFGTGPVILGGLSDEAYHLDDDPDVEGNVFIKEDRELQNIRPALAATIHLSPRTCKQIKFEGVIGFGLNMNDFTDATIYAGGGIMIGRDPWASIHFGPAWSQVQVLKTSLNLEQSYSADEVKADELTQKAYRVGWFGGISFIWPQTDQQQKKAP